MTVLLDLELPWTTSEWPFATSRFLRLTHDVLRRKIYRLFGEYILNPKPLDSFVATQQRCSQTRRTHRHGKPNHRDDAILEAHTPRCTRNVSLVATAPLLVLGCPLLSKTWPRLLEVQHQLINFCPFSTQDQLDETLFISSWNLVVFSTLIPPRKADTPHTPHTRTKSHRTVAIAASFFRGIAKCLYCLGHV